MTLLIDGASPALATGTGSSVTSASFTRPEGGYLVALVAAVTDGTPSVSGGGLTWTRRRQEVQFETDHAEIWTALVTGSGSMTVQLSGLSETQFGRFGALKVVAITGQHEADPIGEGDSGTSSNNTLATSYTSSAIGSRGFLMAMDSNGLGAPSAGADIADTFNQSLDFFAVSGAAVVKAANATSEGETVAFSVDAPGSSTAAWVWAMLEIVAQPAPVRPAVVRSTAAVQRAASW